VSASVKHDARLNFRLPGKLKQLIEQAAAQSGQTVSEFAVSALVQSAYAVMQQYDRTALTNRDRDVFIAMLDDIDTQPNAALTTAAEKYKRRMG
jgi:uncharacterized protein (DUF1778 family)